MASKGPRITVPSTTDEQHPARDEAARQLVILAAGLAFVGLAAWLERVMSSPDAARTIKMHGAHQAEVALATLAAWSWRWAERARVAYQAEAG